MTEAIPSPGTNGWSGENADSDILAGLFGRVDNQSPAVSIVVLAVSKLAFINATVVVVVVVHSRLGPQALLHLILLCGLSPVVCGSGWRIRKDSIRLVP